MAEERTRVRGGKHVSVWKSLIDIRVIALGGVHFAQAGVSVGMAVFVTLIVKQLGHSNMETGWLTAIPFIFGTLGILIWGHISDRMNERKWNLTASCTVSMIGWRCGILQRHLYFDRWAFDWNDRCMSNAHLFPIPSMFLTGAAAASGIAWVNSLGILAGGVTSPVIGYLKDTTGNYASGLYFLAVLGLMGAVITIVIGVRGNLRQTRTWFCYYTGIK